MKKVCLFIFTILVCSCKGQMFNCYDNYTDESSVILKGLTTGDNISVCRDDDPSHLNNLSCFSDDGELRCNVNWKSYQKGYSTITCAEPHRIKNSINLRLTGDSQANFKLCQGEGSYIIPRSQNCPAGTQENTSNCD